MDTSNFKFIFLGQSVLRYQVPLEIFHTINGIYETKYPELKPANKQLVGKIQKEHSLFFNGEDSYKMTKHNHLPQNVLKWFEQKFEHYLRWNNVTEYSTHFNSIWVNQMFEHEYNPVHVHQGTLYTGLSSVMILKLPASFGIEYNDTIVGKNMHKIHTRKIEKKYNPYIEKIPQSIRDRYEHIRF